MERLGIIMDFDFTHEVGLGGGSIMNQIIDFNGIPIDISKVKHYQIQQFEYIFRPVFREVSSGRLFKKTSAEFEGMEPYAVILGINGRKSALAEFKPTNIMDAAIVDLGTILNDLVSGLARLLGVNSIDNAVFTCLLTGDVPQKLRLREVPARLIQINGQPRDVYPNDQVFSMIGEHTKPVHQKLKALTIDCGEKRYALFDNIQVPNVDAAYQTLHHSILAAQEQKELEEAEKKRALAEKRPVIVLPDVPKFVKQLLNGGNANSEKQNRNGQVK